MAILKINNNGAWEGIASMKGDQGIQGPQGIQGIQGETGPQGIQGIQGETGPQGIQGPKGDTGTGIPVNNPSTDGIYKLVNTVETEGGIQTATTSWEEDSAPESYTAGDYIYIDENGQISNCSAALYFLQMFNSGYVNGYSVGMSFPQYDSLQGMATAILKCGGVQYRSAAVYFNAKAFNDIYGTNFSIRYYNTSMPSYTTSASTDITNYNSTSTTNIPYVGTNVFVVVRSGTVLHVFQSYSSLRAWFGYNLGSMLQIKTDVSNIHSTSNRIDQVFSNLNTFVGDIKEKIPDAPTTDGDYVLKCSVSSGIPTYSWVSSI